MVQTPEFLWPGEGAGGEPEAGGAQEGGEVSEAQTCLSWDSLGGKESAMVSLLLWPMFLEPLSSLEASLSDALRGPLVGGDVSWTFSGPSAPLSFAASPVVKLLPSVVRAVAEEEVLLPCEASGIPRPTITWQKEGLNIPAGEGPWQPAWEGKRRVWAWGVPVSCPGRPHRPAERSWKAPGLPRHAPPLLWPPPPQPFSCHHGLRCHPSTRWLSWEVGSRQLGWAWGQASWLLLSLGHSVTPASHLLPVRQNSPIYPPWGSPIPAPWPPIFFFLIQE